MFLKKNRNCLPSCSVCSSVPTFFSFVLLHRPGASNLSGRGPQQLLCAGSWEARLKFTVSGIIDCFQFQKLSRMCARRRMRRRRRRRILHNDATYFWELLSSNTVCIYCIWDAGRGFSPKGSGGPDSKTLTVIFRTILRHEKYLFWRGKFQKIGNLLWRSQKKSRDAAWDDSLRKDRIIISRIPPRITPTVIFKATPWWSSEHVMGRKMKCLTT